MTTKVLWLVKGLGVGGMEQLLVNHARRADRERFDLIAAYVVDRPHDVIRELERQGVPCFRLGSGRLEDPRWLRDLSRLVSDESVDVVHIHSPLVAGLARPVLRMHPRKPAVMSTEHNSWEDYRWPTRLIHGVTYRMDRATLAVSDQAAETPPRWVGARAEVLFHGVDTTAVASHRAARERLREELGVTDRVVIGNVANLRESKNLPLLLEVADQVTAECPDAVFLQVGQGPLAEELHAAHAALGLGERFRFLGFRPDVLDVMSAFDVFVLSSDVEGLPVAVMEAKAMGLPIVATTVGGLPTAVRDGEGLLVPPKQKIALGAALTRLVRDATIRSQLAGASMSSAERFDARNAVKRLEEIYSDLTP
jgi:glycosyltransferase involved in cell wall biosynthesis